MNTVEKQPQRLQEREIPALTSSQIDVFTAESMRIQKEGGFENQIPEGKSVIAVDIGGDSLTASVVTVMNGNFNHVLLADLSDVQHGEGYVTALEGVAAFAEDQNLAIGLSYAGPIDGYRLQGGVNVKAFMDELEARYDGDLARLLPTLVAPENDAISGLRRGSFESLRTNETSSNVIYVINGSGFNTAFLVNGELYSSESGHVELDPALNAFGQTKRCGLFDAEFVCVESVAANKAGIEDIWAQQTGRRLNGREIEALYLRGNQLACELYDNSALVTAHIIAGAARGMGLSLQDGSTAIVGHGGTFKFPGYGERLNQILTHNLESNSPLLLTKDFSQNACLEGAAMAALTKC